MIEEITTQKPRYISLFDRILTPLLVFATKRFLSFEPEGSIIVELPNGRRFRFGKPGDPNEAVFKLNNYGALLKSMRRGAVGFGEAYILKDFDSPDIKDMFTFFLINMDKFEQVGGSVFRVRSGDRAAHRKRRNTKKGARRNIVEHYDLGNDFYAQWLDETMNYSSALYKHSQHHNQDLEAAQKAKLDLIIDMLDLKGGEEILEIGCGWGAFAERVIAQKQTSVTGITLSHEQLAYAQERMKNQGNRVRLAYEDYRDTQGIFDRIASIEMIEAVGEDNWPTYFQTVSDRLKKGGNAVIQAITLDEAHFDTYRIKPDFIQRYIFPGGMLLTKQAIKEHADKAGLTLEQTRFFGRSYAHTLRAWYERFEQKWPEISKLGFDERFKRKWRYYLNYCEVGFAHGVIDVGAYKLVKN